MVKLTPELIEQAMQFTNPVRDRELDLRGYKISIIENLGATLDQFDTIDFSDNELKRLEGFPLLKRIKCLLLNNNQILRFSEGLEQNLPNLESVIMTNNNIQDLSDVDPLATIKTLKTLSFLQNPVVHKKHYRLYVIHRIPQLRLLDFQKIKQKERDAAAAMFKGKKGQTLVREISKRTNTFVPGASISGPEKVTNAVKSGGSGPNNRTRQEAIAAAIASAQTLDEIERLNQMLQSGHLPERQGQNGFPEGGRTVVSTVNEEDDDEEMEN